MVVFAAFRWAAAAIALAVLMKWSVVAMAAEGVQSGKARPFVGFDGCFERMARAVSGREATHREAYASMMESVETDGARKAVVEAFIGMRYAELCSADEVEESWSAEIVDFADRDGSDVVLRKGAGDGEERMPSGLTGSVSSEGQAKAKVAAVDGEECMALADLYDATGGVFWTHRDGWSDRPALLTGCCGGGVYGVECDGDGTHITGLDLSANNLRGPIPPSIGALKGLMFL